jgi:hypothetical protein
MWLVSNHRSRHTADSAISEANQIGIGVQSQSAATGSEMVFFISGGGQAGLSASYNLKRKDRDYILANLESEPGVPYLSRNAEDYAQIGGTENGDPPASFH